MSTVTLEQARDLLASYLDDRGCHIEAENIRKGIDLESYENELKLVGWLYCHTRLAQTTRAVDVGAIREVIPVLEMAHECVEGDRYDEALFHIGMGLSKLTRAIGNAQAEGWRELEAEARRLYNASVGDANNLHCLAWSELSKDQQRKWISKASTAPSTQATPNAHE